MKKHKNKDHEQDQYQQGYGAPSHSSHGSSGVVDQLGNFFKK